MSGDKCERVGLATLGSVQVATGVMCCLSSVFVGPASLCCNCCLGEMVIKAGADCVAKGQKNIAEACCGAERPEHQQMDDDEPPPYKKFN
ncbi:MAG TPA: hypothetical protein VHE99_04360 [Gammaproteobacteria bacterium]|nr:hypothetical protein [Gammaproteobacteria bacterium]